LPARLACVTIAGVATASTFDISLAVTSAVVTVTAVAAVLASRGIGAAVWFEAVGAAASITCGTYLVSALGAGDGPWERRRAAGWIASAGLALGVLIVFASLRDFFTA
jgi:hypothetical protein